MCIFPIYKSVRNEKDKEKRVLETLRRIGLLSVDNSFKLWICVKKGTRTKTRSSVL